MSRRHPSLVVVTGVSATGKTTLCDYLASRKSLPDFAIRQIDEAGVPPVGRGGWRLYRIEQLLFESTALARAGGSTLLAGIIKPHEVYESQYLPPRTAIHFILLDLSDGAIRRRLDERIANVDRYQDASQSGGFDESFSKRSRAQTLRSNLETAAQLRQTVGALRQGHVLHVETQTVEQTAASVVQLANQALHGPA